MFRYRQRRLFISSLKRSMRWEFWPVWLFYIPVAGYILLLTLRYRGLMFTAVNPGMEGSGVIGEKKSESLSILQSALPRQVALMELVSQQQPVSQQLAQCLAFIKAKHLNFPIIVKPDSDQRGIDVVIANDQSELAAYFNKTRFDTIIQEYVPGVEFGVFYYRNPPEPQGKIFSLTHKCFPSVVGNGKDTLEALILSHPRLHYMARFLLKLYSEKLQMVPAIGEEVKVVRLGSHCRGSLFLEGKQYHTSQAEAAIETISQQLPGFFFGRYDIRADSIEAFQRGEFKVIEVNGVTSESTNIYDPQYSLFDAYRILFKQWRLAFAIGQDNKSRGHATLRISELLNKARIMNREVKKV